MQIIDKNIDELVPYEKNPRKNDAAVDKVAASIREFGFKVPIVVDKDNVIAAGHTRYKAAKKLGLETVPCIIADDLTDKQIKAFRLADNKVAEKSEWDFDLLGDELDDILNIDMSQFGFDLSVEDEEPEAHEDDYDIEPPEEPKAKYGDVYRLGNHILMCGDGTKKRDIEKLMDGAVADLVFTDPPYGMKKESEGVINDNLNFDDLLEFNKKWIPLSFDALKDNGSWYCWGIDEPLMDIYSNILKPMAKANKITFRNLITWDKGNGQGQLSELLRSYATADEKCLFVMCGVQGFNNNADNYYEGWEPIREYLENSKNAMGWNKKDIDRICGVTTVARHCFDKSQWLFPSVGNYKKLQTAAENQRKQSGKENDAFKREYDELKREYDELKREYYSTRAYFDNTHDNMNNVWHFERTSKEEREHTGGHATPKPIALCARAIKSSSREGEGVLDLFGGSGSTLIACEQLNRKCYMMEFEPKYVDVIINRWEDFTGEKAELIEGE